jgi:hypothetical protein
LFRLVQAIELSEGPAAASFDASMTLFEAFNKTMRRIGGRMSAETVPEYLEGIP